MRREDCPSVLAALGNEVARLRKQRGVSQAELAQKAGVGLSTVRLTESGKTNLTVASLVLLANALEVRASALLSASSAPLKRGPLDEARPRQGVDLEGAATTRADAIAMLRTGRKPRDRSERMILNNYLAMQRIGQLRNEPLTPDLVLELHAVVTEDTLDEAHSAGRMQTPTDLRVKVWDEQTGEILHDPPPADQLPDRLRLMCDFANGTVEAQGYLHPIVKAILLHFWLAHDHPFADGNGRTARALFYWHMLREGYWLTEFISISSLIRKAPVKYARSFLWTETDANDLTYFVLAQLGIIAQSIDALENYIARKSSELRSVDQRLRALDRINHRQKALLAHALKNRHAVYSIQSHCRSHGVAYATGRADLLELCRLGLLTQLRQGKAFKFRAPDDLSSRLMLLEE